MSEVKANDEVKELLLLANSQIHNLLALLGVNFTQSGDWISSTCPVHCGDNRHAFGFNVRTGTWRCFTHGCQEGPGKDLIGLIRGILHCSYDRALDWIIDNVKDGGAITQLIKHKEEDKIFPEHCLKRLFRTDFYLKRGFSQSTLDEFEHGQAESGKMYGRIVFPFRDEKGFIRGFSGRWAGKEEVVNGKIVCFSKSGKEVPKWKHLVTKTNYLYNFYRAKNFCQDELIIVESIGNVMRMWECGLKNCVACLGSSLSTIQVQLIIANTKKVVMAFDNDIAGNKFLKKSTKRLEQYIKIRELIPPVGKDWAELHNEEVKKIYANF